MTLQIFARVKQPFTVVEMKTPDFKNNKKLCKILLREKECGYETKILLRESGREKVMKVKPGCKIFNIYILEH